MACKTPNVWSFNQLDQSISLTDIPNRNSIFSLPYQIRLGFSPTIWASWSMKLSEVCCTAVHFEVLFGRALDLFACVLITVLPQAHIYFRRSLEHIHEDFCVFDHTLFDFAFSSCLMATSHLKVVTYVFQLEVFPFSHCSLLVSPFYHVFHSLVASCSDCPLGGFD